LISEDELDGAQDAHASADKEEVNAHIPATMQRVIAWSKKLFLTLMPSIVSEVSAILVASTILRAPGGVTSKILDCKAFRTSQQPVTGTVAWLNRGV